MDASALTGRVKSRFLEGEEIPADEVIEEMLRTVIDRLQIRMESAGELPGAAGSIAVDAAVKALRLRGFEGSTSESASDGGSVSNSFIDDVLSAYDKEISSLKRMVNRAGIKFLR